MIKPVPEVGSEHEVDGVLYVATTNEQTCVGCAGFLSNLCARLPRCCDQVLETYIIFVKKETS